MESKEFKARACRSTKIKVTEKFSISKSQILQTLDSLRSEAIVSYHPGRGYFAASLPVQERKCNLSTIANDLNKWT